MSARRVYLMADFGKGPRVVQSWPKCRTDEWTASGVRRPPQSPTTFDEARYRTRPGSRVDGVLASGLPTWLVEADSADAARLVIKASQTHDSEGRAYSEDQRRVFARVGGGRILASGGTK